MRIDVSLLRLPPGTELKFQETKTETIVTVKENGLFVFTAHFRNGFYEKKKKVTPNAIEESINQIIKHFVK